MKVNVLIFAACTLLFGTVFTADIFAEDTDYAPMPEYSTTPIDARETNFEKTPFNKITRGITNTAFFWIEVPAGMKETAKERNDEFTGLSLGLIKGVFSGFLRLATGIFDVVTFIIPPYDRPLMDPEYVFSRCDS